MKRCCIVRWPLWVVELEDCIQRNLSLDTRKKRTSACSRGTSVLVDDSTITCFVRCRMKLWVGVYGLYLGLYLEKQWRLSRTQGDSWYFRLGSRCRVMGRAKTLSLPKCSRFASSPWFFSLHTIPCRQIIMQTNYMADRQATTPIDLDLQ